MPTVARIVTQGAEMEKKRLKRKESMLLNYTSKVSYTALVVSLPTYTNSAKQYKNLIRIQLYATLRK